jgi:hypothetical protein
MRFSGQITPLGRLVLDDEPRWRAQLAKWKERRVSVVISVRRQGRSVKANAYLWGVVYATIAEWSGHEADEIHEALKVKFLTPHPESLPNGFALEMRPSTASLDSKAFAEYVDKVRRWAAECGLYIPSPDDPPEEL